MKVVHLSVFVLTLLAAISLSAPIREPVYWDVAAKIREEGLNNSHIMEDIGYMTDVYGPRLAKSRAHRAAVEWAKNKFEEYGLNEVRIETYDFGIGWELEYTSVHMLSPQYMPIIAYPQPWSAPTPGKVKGHVVHINFEDIETETDLEKYRGKLKGAIVFSTPKQKMYLRWDPEAVLYSDELLDEMAQIPTSESMEEYLRDAPKAPEVDRWQRPVYQYPRRKIIDFLLEEGITAIAARDGMFDDGTVQVNTVTRQAWAEDAPQQPTSFILAAEHYNRIMRILAKDIPVEMEVELRACYTREDLNGHNLIAEIKGTDLADEVVIVAAHYDGCIAGTGAEDNACGAAHVLEAARILKAIDARPRRTIRFALWDGHESGRSGARAYCAEHYFDAVTMQHRSEYEKLAGYYNLDYGTGKIRGVYLFHNSAAKPIFEEWMKPLHDLGMKHAFLVPSYDAGTEGYHEAGLPAFKFCQDPVENDSRTYHSNMDVYDRIVPEYLKQGAVVVATIAYHTAMRAQKLPVKGTR